MLTDIVLRIGCFAVINAVCIVIGYKAFQQANVFAGWLMLVIAVPVVTLLFYHDNPILKMLAIIATTFNCVKVVTSAQSNKERNIHLSFFQWLVFTGAWAGMKPQAFETFGESSLPGAWSMILFGVSRVIIGLVIIAIAHTVSLCHVDEQLKYIILCALLLPALSLILHFGLLNISAGALRLQGANTYYLFRHPVRSSSLAEFWGKRWNIAFVEMTTMAIFKPLKGIVSTNVALLTVFAFSGLLHELALSVPVNSGYGKPFLYFMLQAVFLFVERFLKSKGSLHHKITARVWTMACVIFPVPLLFHSAFMHGVVFTLTRICLNN